MFTIASIVQPDTIEDAYKTLMLRKTNVVLGGCAFLKMGSQQIGTGIDLSNLGLSYIAESSGFVEIGAATTFRQIETHPVLAKTFSGLLPSAVRAIIGIQFRNVVMLGGSVFSKYGFSDLLTALLALETEVELYGKGRIPLPVFLSQPVEKDLLTRIFIKNPSCLASFQSLRNSASDYSVLNVAVSCWQDQWRIAVGARPGRAVRAVKAAAFLSGGVLSSARIEDAVRIATEELSFGSNLRGNAEYRRALCRVLVKRAISEVSQCE